MEKIDWFGIFAILFMVVGGCMVSYHYIIEDIHSCTSKPILYGIEKIVDADTKFPENTNYTYVEVGVYFDANSNIPIKTYAFNWGVGKRYEMGTPQDFTNFIILIEKEKNHSVEETEFPPPDITTKEGFEKYAKKFTNSS